MRTDTIVAVSGAFVLAAVMVGVYVYEANHQEPATSGTKTGPDVSAFEAKYKSLGLRPFEDIDGDGQTNLNDTDLDQDGVPNADDLTVDVSYTINATMPQGTTPGSSTKDHPFVVGHGVKSWSVTLSYDGRLPAPVGPLPGISLSAPESGATACSRTFSGNQVTCAVQLDSEFNYGAFNAHLVEDTPGPDTPYTLAFHVAYGTVPAPAK